MQKVAKVPTSHLLPAALAREAGKVVKGTTSASDGLESSRAPALSTVSPPRRIRHVQDLR